MREPEREIYDDSEDRAISEMKRRLQQPDPDAEYDRMRDEEN